jgi:hypothetical protein
MPKCPVCFDYPFDGERCPICGFPIIETITEWIKAHPLITIGILVTLIALMCAIYYIKRRGV